MGGRMREALARLKDQRITIHATVRRQGRMARLQGQQFPTLLLGNVQLPDGTALAEHCWVYLTKTLRELELVPGDVLQCTARVRVYRKGYVGIDSLHKSPGGIDYTFEHLDTCVCIQRAATRREVLDG